MAKNGIPSQDTLIEVKEAATPTEIAGPYFEMPGELQEALTARQAWREHVKQELEALLFSIEGVTKVEVSFDPIDMDAPIRSIQRVDIEISGDLSTEINLDGFRNQIFLMLDNDIPLEDITLK